MNGEHEMERFKERDCSASVLLNNEILMKSLCTQRAPVIHLMIGNGKSSM